MKNASYFSLLVGILGLALMPGCPGGPPMPPDAGVFSGQQVVEGRVDLPDGVVVDLASLSVATNAGNAPVMADGSVEPMVVTDAPSLAQVIDDAGNIILLAFLMPDSAKQSVDQSIGADSTADALIFLAIGGFTAPVEAWPSLLERIGASPEAAAVSAAFGNALAENPRALADGSAEVDAALAAARQALAIAPDVKHWSKGEDEEDEFTLSPGPSSDQSGVRAALAQDNESIRVENIAPRRIQRQFLKTAEVNGEIQMLNPPEVIAGLTPVGPARAVFDPIAETITFEAMTNTFGIPFREGSANFSLLVFGPTLDPDDMPRELETEQYAPFADTWRAALDSLTATTIIQDILLRLVQTLAVGVVEPANDEDEASATIAADGALLDAGFDAGAVNSVALLQALAGGIFDDSGKGVDLIQDFVDAIILGWEPDIAAHVDKDAMELALRRAAQSQTMFRASLLGLQEDDAGGVIESLVDADAIEDWSLRIRSKLTFCGDEFDIEPFREAAELTTVTVETPIVAPGDTLRISMTINWDLRREDAPPFTSVSIGIADIGDDFTNDLRDLVLFDGMTPEDGNFSILDSSGLERLHIANFGELGDLNSFNPIVVSRNLFRPANGGTTSHTLEVPIPLGTETTCPFFDGSNGRISGNFVTFKAGGHMFGVFPHSADQFVIREVGE